MFYENITRITDSLHKDQCIFMIEFRSLLLRMRNVSDKIVEKVKTHISYPVTFLRKSCRL
jgi:hypothetical protein